MRDSRPTQAVVFAGGRGTRLRDLTRHHLPMPMVRVVGRPFVDQLARLFRAAGGRIDRIYACLGGWDDGCGCRTQGPGTLFAAQRDLGLVLSLAVMAGDERDEEAAAAPGRGCGRGGARQVPAG